jgi:excisionase family DNA binding protein
MTETPPPVGHGRSMGYAAAQIGVCKRTAYDLVRRGILRTYKVGRARRCTDAAIADAIRRLEAATSPAAPPVSAL